MLHTTATCLTPWTVPPALTAEGLALVSDGPALVLAVEPLSNRAIWRHEADGETNLSGAAPEVRIDGDVAFALIGRNTGRELLGLNAKSGLSEWRTPALVSGGGVSEMVFDADRIYLIQADGVACFIKTSGRRAWRHQLPGEAHCQAVVTGRGLLLCRTGAEENVAGVISRLLRRAVEWPSLLRILSTTIALGRALLTGTATILLLDAETGEEVSRTETEVVGPFARLQRAEFGAVLLDVGTARAVNLSR